MDAPSARESLRAWETIAESFDATRTRPWRPVEEFLQGLPVGTRLLDAGAGNGRHAAVASRRGLRVVGLDASARFLRMIRKREPGVATVRGLLERLPFRTASFQAVVAIASVHHVRGRANRLEVWREVRRVLGAGGPLLASTWHRDQPRFAAAEGLQQPDANRGPPVDTGDVLLRWTQHGLDVRRFVHLYAEDELRQELSDAGFRIGRAWLAQIASPEAPDNQFVLALA